ncbi:MAG: hypothetical protein UV41_C0054G0002 [Candidatus Daviesbacteria bacterium GW2011_GWA2_42_7]|uniref:Dolichyl-phosphooligosaccharide-protein glycotransferase n=1 Tax=Candidatus Daviesbacteria bacterium GW2011_GWA2_42_7 TaxID=1618425 RepID=A0A0G1B869_9BACT|nr:MAG: hypothetical protein UV41_C0054G0002 [Candidatus Daviesbacteria bacterium GW2011_GWA2_42_7]
MRTKTKIRLILHFLLGFITVSATAFALLWLTDFFMEQVSSTPRKITYGVTFSAPYARYLGLDPEKVLESINKDLNVKLIRIPVYWDEVEKEPGVYDFSTTDRLLDIAKTGNPKITLSNTLNFIFTMLVFTFFTIFISRIEWISRGVNQVITVIPKELLPFAALAILVCLGAAAFAFYQYVIRKTAIKENTRKTISFWTMAIMYGLILVMVVAMVVNDSLRAQNVLGTTVGEENTGIQFFGEKYNALIIFPLLALAIIPWRMYKHKNDNTSQLVFFWILITLFMAWYKLKFTYTFGLPLAAGAGVVFIEVLDYVKQRSPFEKKVVGLSLAFMVLVGVGAASIFMTTKAPNIETTSGWKPTLYWLRDNTPKDAQMFNWWDEGHWISFIGERKVITDNRNLDGQANAAYAQFILSTDENNAYTLVMDPKKIIQTDRNDFGPYNSDYVIFGDDILSKTGSMAFYAYNTIDPNDPRLQGYFGAGLPCSLLNSVSQSKTYACSGNTLTEAQMTSLPPVWTPVANQLIAENVPGFVYRNADNSAIYIFNQKTNNTMAVKLWFNDPTITHFREVSFKGGVKVYKVVP